MPRAFAPPSEIRTSIGACNFAGFTTIALIFKATAITATADWQHLFGVHNASANLAGPGGIWRVSDNATWAGQGDIFYSTSDGGPGCYFLDGLVPNDVWCLLVVRKGAGTVQPRASLYRWDTDVWAHSAPYLAQAVADGGSAAGGTVRFGQFNDGDSLTGDFEAAAGWDSLVFATDGAVEAAGLELALANWQALNPKGLWLFEQASITDPVLDLTAGGADQTFIEGTSISSSVPPVFDPGTGPGPEPPPDYVPLLEIVQALADQITDHVASQDLGGEALQVWPAWVVSPTPPCIDIYAATPFSDQLAYGPTRQRDVRFTVRARVKPVDFDASQEQLLQLMDSRAPTSVLAAIYADRTLGGLVSDVTVTEMTGVVPYTPLANEGTLIGCEWQTRILL
jgi:hypothetical protein